VEPTFFTKVLPFEEVPQQQKQIKTQTFFYKDSVQVKPFSLSFFNKGPVYRLCFRNHTFFTKALLSFFSKGQTQVSAKLQKHLSNPFFQRI